MQAANLTDDLGKIQTAATVARLRDQILEGAHLPGSRLNEVQIAKALGVGRTKLRDAFHQLAREGLVQRIPNRGTFVVSLDFQDLLELFEVREGLETMAARLTAERATGTQIAELRAISEQTEVILESGRDMPYPHELDLHAAIFAATGNGRLIQRGREIHLQLGLARSRSGYRPTRARHAHLEHVRIVTAIADGDPEQAESLMRIHLGASLRHIQAFLPRSSELGNADVTQIA